MSSHGTALSLGQFAELVAVVTRNLPRDIDPDVADCWVRNGKTLAKVLLNSLGSPTPCFPVWKTVELGAIKKSAEYLRVLGEVRVNVDMLAKGILNDREFTCAKDPTDVDLVALSVADLGLNKTTTYGDVCARALKLGLELCPAEVGPILRLIYLKQTDDEGLVIGMKPFTYADGTQSVFALWHHGNTPQLCTHYGNPEFPLHLNQFPLHPDHLRFVFVRPRARQR